jgi:hypothetical protein
MRTTCLRKFTSLLLVVMILAASVHGFCQESHAMEQSPVLSADTGWDAGQSPSCPGEDHSDADHDAASCFCSCHLPMIVLPLDIQPSPIVGTLSFFDRFTALPEIYLPKFIPPQNLA